MSWEIFSSDPVHNSYLLFGDSLFLILFTAVKNMMGNQCSMCSMQNKRLPDVALPQKATIHQVTAMLATSKTVLFTGHNHLLTTNADYPSLAGARAIIKVSGHQHQWLACDYNLEIGQF